MYNSTYKSRWFPIYIVEAPISSESGLDIEVHCKLKCHQKPISKLIKGQFMTDIVKHETFLINSKRFGGELLPSTLSCQYAPKKLSNLVNNPV